LRRAEALRDELTHLIVHDLREPLTVIHLNLAPAGKAVQDPARAEMLRHALMTAQTNLTIIVDMIDDILKVSKLEDGALQPMLAPMNLAQLVRQKEPGYRLRAEEDNKSFINRVQADLPLLQADAGLIGRVIDNLVSNALKYTEAGGQIEIAAERQDTFVFVHICDDGSGIAPDYHTRIFDKYFQVTDEAGQPLRKGTGIGLTFCRLAVEAHGGRIWVDSGLGRGSVFSFALPLQ
jgi:two-component system, sensor histidine kinase and response regulator